MLGLSGVLISVRKISAKPARPAPAGSAMSGSNPYKFIKTYTDPEANYMSSRHTSMSGSLSTFTARQRYYDVLVISVVLFPVCRFPLPISLSSQP